jgi:hypothetical protein
MVELPYTPASRSQRSFRSDQWRRKSAAKTVLDEVVLTCTVADDPPGTPATVPPEEYLT